MSGFELLGVTLTPSEALAWATAGGALAFRPVKFLIGRATGSAVTRADRVENLEAVVEILRKVLDKGRIRENALVTVTELLIFALGTTKEPCSVVTQARELALELLIAARAELRKVNETEERA